ncbi:hypothetical protein ACFRI7_26355 [Streptomyces sp. NPDC056716]|uniref:hypothetical protein n=1 Tax=unclassified Streptomyces TaxID=2593676 RepID=UPI0036B85B25
MLAVRLSRAGRPAVQLRRLLVAAASGGTGFLLLCILGHAMSHPGNATGSALRLAWCLVPIAATVQFAVAVARTDPGTRPRPGLSAIGLGPARLMAVSATTTALSTVLGSMLALLFFLHLRGDLTGMPFDGAAADVLAAGRPLPLPAALTLLTVIPVAASVTTALVLRPREPGAARRRARNWWHERRTAAAQTAHAAHAVQAARAAEVARIAEAQAAAEAAPGIDPDGAPGSTPQPTARETGQIPAPDKAPTGLPWGVAVLAAGLAVEAYATRVTPGTDATTLPGGLAAGPVSVLVGWTLTAVGLALAGPGLTHLCGRLLQAGRPGALRLLAGRVLMAEAGRIGRPLGVVCAVASAGFATAALRGPGGADEPVFGPLTTLGALLVAGCTLATLCTAAVEARHARADTTAALLRLGAPAATLRSAAALRAGALLALFGPLTLVVAQLAAQPLLP